MLLASEVSVFVFVFRNTTSSHNSTKNTIKLFCVADCHDNWLRTVRLGSNL